jgi:hypothetical protein
LHSISTVVTQLLQVDIASLPAAGNGDAARAPEKRQSNSRQPDADQLSGNSRHQQTRYGQRHIDQCVLQAKASVAAPDENKNCQRQQHADPCDSAAAVIAIRLGAIDIRA